MRYLERRRIARLSTIAINALKKKRALLLPYTALLYLSRYFLPIIPYASMTPMVGRLRGSHGSILTGELGTAPPIAPKDRLDTPLKAATPPASARLARVGLIGERSYQHHRVAVVPCLMRYRSPCDVSR